MSGRHWKGPQPEMIAAYLLWPASWSLTALEGQVSCVRGESLVSKPMATANVYVIGLSEGPVKIGITTRKPKGRLAVARAQIEIEDVEVLWSQPHAEAFLVEKFSHMYLEAFHLHGEWFDATLRQAKVAIDRSINMLATRPCYNHLYQPTWFEKVGIRKTVAEKFVASIPKKPAALLTKVSIPATR
jgi:hypothetical protein